MLLKSWSTSRFRGRTFVILWWINTNSQYVPKSWNFATIQNCFYQNNILNNLIGYISYVPKPGFGKHEICDQKVTCLEKQLLVNQDLENLKYVIRRRKTTLAFLYAFMDIFCYFKDIIFFELFTLWFHQFSRIFKPIRSSSLSDSDKNKVKHALVFSELVKPCHEQLTGCNNKKLNMLQFFLRLHFW